MKNLALIALALSVAGCGSAKREDVVGDYRADRGYGIETLELKNEGTYEQTFVSSAHSQKVSGRWTYHPESSRIGLEDVLLFDDGWGRQLIEPERTNLSLAAEKLLGGISLVYGEAAPFMREKK
jgi:hypothetical protein